MALERAPYFYLVMTLPKSKKCAKIKVEDKHNKYAN